MTLTEHQITILNHVRTTVQFGSGVHRRAGKSISESGIPSGWHDVDFLVDNGFLVFTENDCVATEKGLKFIE